MIFLRQILGLACNTPRRGPVRVGAIVLTVVLLAACGQKGPLYLPSQEQPPKNTTSPAR